MAQAPEFSAQEISIRTAKQSDADALVALTAQLGYKIESSRARERLFDLNNAGDLVLVAVYNSKVIGMAVLHRTPFLHRPPDGRISTLVVFDSYRSRGVGALLVEAAEKTFRKLGCTRVEVTSGAAREAAHRFYLREGYEEQPKRFIKQLHPSSVS
jgi:GNAT superfamily N-acetyltransferase